MAAHKYNHLTVYLKLPDQAFEDFWAYYLKQKPGLVEGATIEFSLKDLQTLQKIAFVAGRDAALEEFRGAGSN